MLGNAPKNKKREEEKHELEEYEDLYGPGWPEGVLEDM